MTLQSHDTPDRTDSRTDTVNPLRRLALDDLRRRTSMKWRAHPEDVLPLWVAEMDVPLAEPVARALTRAVAEGDTGYPVDGTEYADALAAFAERHWNWRVETEHTALVPDVMLGVVEVLGLVTDPGDAVIVNPPVYPPFYAFVEHAGRRIVEASLGAEHRLDFSALEDAYARAVAEGRPAVHLLCNPHNPTGTVHTRAELERVAELARKHGVRVVSDEIHAPLVLPGAVHAPYLSVRGSDDAFALLSASKAWNLAGCKAALAVAGPESAADLARMPEEVGHGASHLGVIAHVAALRHGDDWLDALLAGVDENRRLLVELLDRHLPDVHHRTPQGTYLAWLDCRALGLGDDPAAVFLERGRVALNSGLDYGTGGAGYVRLNLATSPEILTEAVERMATVL